ncbi:MAG TPA: hypothetical protein VI756_03060 [Blastocatellia bacterium]
MSASNDENLAAGYGCGLIVYRAVPRNGWFKKQPPWVDFPVFAPRDDEPEGFSVFLSVEALRASFHPKAIVSLKVGVVRNIHGLDVVEDTDPESPEGHALLVGIPLRREDRERHEELARELSKPENWRPVWGFEG